MAPSDGAAVVILKFNDYQCPGCGQTYRDHKPVLAKWAKQSPGKVKFITKDFPLEKQCNQSFPQDMHLGACEAAVAVRLAREKGKAEAMEEWLYSNQAAMNPDSVKKAAASIGGVTDFDARFAGTLELVKADVAQGVQLKIKRHAELLHERHATAWSARRVLRRRDRMGIAEGVRRQVVGEAAPRHGSVAWPRLRRGIRTYAGD